MIMLREIEISEEFNHWSCKWSAVNVGKDYPGSDSPIK